MKTRVLITGASSGLGFALAEKLSKEGFNLVLASRQISRELLNSKVLDEGIEEKRIQLIKCDVSSQDDVASLFKNVRENPEELSSVIHCAGVYGPFGPIETIDISQWDDAVKVNLNGTFNVIKNTVRIFKDQVGFGRFVGLSGGGATSPMPRIVSYSATKSAVVRLIESVAADNVDSRMTFNAVAPGIMKTKMLDEVLKSDPELVGIEFYDKMNAASTSEIDSTNLAIDLIKYICEGNLDFMSGRLISAVWDDWRSFDKNTFMSSDDLYTLRRIV